MIIYDLNVFSAYICPPETDTELIVHTNTVLSGAVAFECFKPVSRRNTKIFKSSRDLQLSKLTSCDGFDVDESSDTPTARK